MDIILRHFTIMVIQQYCHIAQTVMCATHRVFINTYIKENMSILSITINVNRYVDITYVEIDNCLRSFL